LGEEEH